MCDSRRRLINVRRTKTVIFVEQVVIGSRRSLFSLSQYAFVELKLVFVLAYMAAVQTINFLFINCLSFLYVYWLFASVWGTHLQALPFTFRDSFPITADPFCVHRMRQMWKVVLQS